MKQFHAQVPLSAHVKPYIPNKLLSIRFAEEVWFIKYLFLPSDLILSDGTITKDKAGIKRARCFAFSSELYKLKLFGALSSTAFFLLEI